MEACDGGDMGFQQETSNSVANRESNSIYMEASAMAMSLHNPLFTSMARNPQRFGFSHQDFADVPLPSFPLWENQPQNLAQHLLQNSSFVEMAPGATCFMSRGLPAMAGPIMGLPRYGPLANVEGGASEGIRKMEGEAVTSPSSEKRRKQTADSSSPYDPNKRDPSSADTCDVQKEHSEKKQRTEQPESTNSRVKHTKDDSNSGELPKENFVHVRARRGQATNSHSLAERVRREKISERMRMLQELVPGCNKITGKAMMLDEIINYVQSLQQQVEFLSMKLATLFPNTSIDLESVLSKEILQASSRDSMARILSPGTGFPLPYSSMQGILQGALLGTSHNPSPLPRAPLENELRTLFLMHFDSGSGMDMLKQNRD